MLSAHSSSLSSASSSNLSHSFPDSFLSAFMALSWPFTMMKFLVALARGVVELSSDQDTAQLKSLGGLSPESWYARG